MATKNPFEELDDQADSKNPFAVLDAQEKQTGFARKAADVGLSVGQGAVGAFKALSDLGGADNAVSRGFGSTAKYLGDQKSNLSKFTQESSARQMKAAEESGSKWEEAKAFVGSVVDQPGEMIGQGIGSFATLGLGKAAQAAKLASAARAAGVSRAALAGTEAAKTAANIGFRTNVAVGGGMGVGAVKGSQFEQTYNNALQQGRSEDEAQALATKAQEYGGAGTGQQLLGGGLGLLASATGPIEKLAFGGRASGEAAQGVAQTFGQKAADVAARSAKGFAVEGATEGLQGAQERFAGNDASVDAGVLAPENRMRGVVGQGLQEGLIGGILGGAGGAMQGRAQPALPSNSGTQPGLEPEEGDPSPEADPLGSPDGTPFTPPPSLTGTPAASLLGNPLGGLQGGGDPLRNVLRPSEEMGLDAAAGPISAAAVQAVDGGATGAGQQAELQKLQERLADVNQRAQDRGSWNVPLMAQKRQVEAEIAKAQAAQSQLSTPGATSATQADQAIQAAPQRREEGAPAQPSLTGPIAGASNAAQQTQPTTQQATQASGPSALIATGIDAEAGASGSIEGGQAQTPAQQAPVALLTRAADIEAGPAVVLQNRDRSSATSVAQMNEIASRPNYLKAGQSGVMDSGAPVVFGDTPPTAAIGRIAEVSDSANKRDTVQYMVVESADLLASNRADGSTVPEYAQGQPGKLRAVAGNGRVAGLAEGYNRGTADQYRAELIADAQALGIDPAAIEAMQAPVLVRVMDGRSVTPDIGDRSNVPSSSQLSPTDQARTDMRRVDLTALEFDEEGDPTERSLLQFIAAMPSAEQSVMRNADLTPNRQATDRMMAATFRQAYGSDALVTLYSQARNPEAKIVLAALADAAGAMAALSNTGELDIRGAVSEAAGLAVNAARQGLKLADFLKNGDMTTSGEAFVIARFFADNARSAKRIAQGLRDWAGYASAQAQIASDNETQDGMFGAAPVATRADVFRRLENGQTTEEDAGQPARVGDAGRSAERAQDQPDAGQAGAATGDAEATTQEVAPPAAATPEPLNEQDAPPAATAEAQAAPDQAPEAAAGARLQVGDRGFATGLVRYVDADGNAISDWAEDEAEARQQAQERLRNARIEKLRQDHFVTSSGFLTESERGVDVAEIQRLMNERDALARQMAEAGLTQMEIGANAARMPVTQFTALVKDGIYPRAYAGALDSLFPKKQNPRQKRIAKAASAGVPAAAGAGGVQADGVNPRVPKENRFTPDGNRQTAEPWQMTSSEFGNQRSGNPHFDQSYQGQDEGAYLADVQATHEALVREAVANGKPVPEKVLRGLSETPTEANTPAEPVQKAPEIEQVAPAPVSVIDKMKAGRAAKESKKAQQLREIEERRAAYFAPGNIVPAYSNTFDEVLAYTPDASGGFTVRVQEVRKVDGKWQPAPNTKPRSHSTQPSERELKAGPVPRRAAESKTDQEPAQPQAEEVTDAQRKQAQEHAENLGGRVVWQRGDIALIEGYSALSGDSVYAASNGKLRTNVDIQIYTGGVYTAEQRAELLKARADAVAAAESDLAKNPDGPFKDGPLAFTDDIADSVRGVVLGWTKLLGLEDARIVITTPQAGRRMADGLAGKYRRIGKASLSGGNTNGVMQPLGQNDFHIAVRPGVSTLKTLEILAHELGHIVERRAFAGASMPMQNAIRGAHNNWLKENGSGRAIDMAQAMRAYRSGQATGFDAIAKAQDAGYYWRSFGEWFADQVSRWATTQKKPVGVVEQFFKRLADQLRTFFVGEKAKFLPDTTVSQWLDSLSKDIAPSIVLTPVAPAAPTLTAPTRADIEAQQGRTEQADKLDARDQVKRESEVGDNSFMTGFAGDGRQDTTGGLFDAPSKTSAPAAPKAITDGKMPKDNPALKKLVEAFDGKPADPARMKQALYALPSMAEEAKQIAGDSPVFSRATDGPPTSQPRFSAAAQAQAVGAVESMTDRISQRWANAPEIIVAFDMNDARISDDVRREDLRQRSGATGTPEGFFYQGKVYLLASKLATPDAVARVLFHEALGHAGLRGVFGGALKPILRQIVTMRRAEVNAKVKEYSLRGGKQLDVMTAAEEVLAEMAQTRPEIGYVKRAIAAIRNFLRDYVPGFEKMKLTDEDIIQKYILPARAWVERGGVGVRAGDAVRFQRAFHGTPHRGIDKFSTDKMGTGEGAQAFGWGLYFAGKRDIAEYYKEKLSEPDIERAVVEEHSIAGDRNWIATTYAKDESKIARSDYLTDDEMIELIGRQAFNNVLQNDSDDDANVYVGKPSGQLYEVEIPEDSEMLLWDKPLDEQSAKVFNTLINDMDVDEGFADGAGNSTGEALYRALSEEYGGDEAASKALLDQGIKGIKYLDGNSRTAGDGSFNYVIFDGADTEVTQAFFSRTSDIESSMGAMNAEQESAYRNVAGVKKAPTIQERFDVLKANFGLKARQALVDQFAAIKQLDQGAYMQARMSKASDGALEAALMYGKPFLRDGVPDVNIEDGGFAKVLGTLKGEHDRFFMWVAAQRAERLKADDKENLFTNDDISALKTLNADKMADGTLRLPVYANALKELNAFNEAMLKISMESGLIDQEAVDLMREQPYVPFYRLMEDKDFDGPRFSAGLTNQKAWKKLKGGTQQLNADLLQNTLMNWSHLLQASARNRAALATMDAAALMDVAYKVPATTNGRVAKDAVKVMRDGKTEHWMVEDPYLLEAIGALNYTVSPLMKPLTKMKQILTMAVTVNPTFKIRNLIRDSVSAIAQSELGYNPVANVGKAWKLTASDAQIYASMLAGGGIIKFGTQENTDRLRSRVQKLGGQMLDQTGTQKIMGQIGSLWDAYQEFGDRTENVNRVALYDQLRKKGHSHAEASFMSRDLMDFTMGGAMPLVRFLTQTVPFLNARLVGLDKLGRAAIEDPRKFATVAGAVSVASVALLAMYADDDDWKAREDWDRDSYWWFKVGDTAFRIPKPFEVGAIGTLAERTAEAMFSDEMTSKRFNERIAHMFSQTFAFDPVPQAIKPLLDVYSNKDSFTRRAIESQSDQRLRPRDRYNERTSETAKLLGQLGLPEPSQLLKGTYTAMSPKQIDHLIRGYFSWVGVTATAAADMVARPMMDQGERPDMQLRDMFLIGNFAQERPAGGSRYVTQLYEQSRQVQQAYASYQNAIKMGDVDTAQEIKESSGDKLRNRMAYARATKQMSELGQQAKKVQSDQSMSGEEKRARLDEIARQRNTIAKRASEMIAQ